MQSLFWEDVNENDQLPPLEFGPMTIKRFMLMAAGSRDFNPQHNNTAWCQATGSRDMFATTPWHEGLFSRYVTDWSGPESDFRPTTLAMVIQLCLGDSIVVNGSVVKKWVDGTDHLVQIEMASSSHLGVVARATATIAMPSRAGGAVQSRQNFVKPALDPHPQMPKWAREELGKVSPMSEWAPFPVSLVQVAYWCEMVEDGNPLYEDSEYARNSRHGGPIAPYSSLLTFAYLPKGSHFGDVDDPNWKPWPPTTGRTMAMSSASADKPTKAGLATGSVTEYGQPLRIGDTFRMTTELVDTSPLKKTHLGVGYFSTSMWSVYNQRDELVAIRYFTGYSYASDPEGIEEAYRLAAERD